VPIYFFHLLSWYALQGTPPPAFVFHRFPLLPTLFLGFIFSFVMFQNIHALRGERCALAPAPPHPLIFLNWLPLLPTILFFLHKHHLLFGLISSLLISIETSAYVLLSWYALRGEALRPPPCTLPPASIFKPVPLATYYPFLFA